MKPLTSVVLFALGNFISATPMLAAAGEQPGPPPPRSRAEVEQVLAVSTPLPIDPKPMRILLVAGPKDHGPGQHDYPAWQKAWAALLPKSSGVTVDTAFPWPRPDQWDGTDVAVFYLRNRWDLAQLAEIEAFQARGGGVVTIHWAIGAGDFPEAFAERVGLAYTSKKYRHGPVDLHLDTDHEITRGLPGRIAFHDESYWPFVGDPQRIRVLGTSEEAMEDGGTGPIPIFWTYEPGAGRAFVCILGHYMWTFDDPLFRVLLLRGIAWAAREPATRLDTLAIDGVTLSD